LIVSFPPAVVKMPITVTVLPSVFVPAPLSVKFVYVPPITVCALVLAYSIVPPQVPAGKDNGVADVAVGHVVLILPLLDNVVVTDKVLLPIANVPSAAIVSVVEI